MSADKHPAGRVADQVRDDVVQQMLADPLDYSSYTIAECRVLQAELQRIPALEAERDQLRAEVEALRADAERMEWLCFAPALMVSANMPAMREWLMKRPAGLNNLRDAIDAARKQQ